MEDEYIWIKLKKKQNGRGTYQVAYLTILVGDKNSYNESKGDVTCT